MIVDGVYVINICCINGVLNHDRIDSQGDLEGVCQREGFK